MRLGILCLMAGVLWGQKPVFLVPVENIDTNRAEAGGGMRTYRIEPDAKYLPWLENDAARRALKLYAQAHAIVEGQGNPQRQPRDYYIALVPGGNHAAVGFRLRTEAGIEDHPGQAFILLDPDPRPFSSTIFHETGHVAMAMLAGGKELPRADVSSIPHSTAALADRATAFSEGFAIHLETLAAHLGQDAAERARFHHEAARFGDGPFRDLEFFRPSADLANYAQTLARYTEVRENHFAFQPAWKGPDYLRVQLEKARDFAELRDANQLLQSEGFHASFFFLFLMRGASRPSEAEIDARQQRMLRAMAAMFASTKADADTPWLPHLFGKYLELFPEDKTALADALNDLSRGVFLEAGARERWRRHYLAALRLDRKGMAIEELQAARKRWREAALADPRALFSQVGPQLRCEVKAVAIQVEAFGEPSPLVFDANTAPEPILRLIPGIRHAEVQAWLAGRPFRDRAGVERAVPGRCIP